MQKCFLHSSDNSYTFSSRRNNADYKISCNKSRRTLSAVQHPENRLTVYNSSCNTCSNGNFSSDSNSIADNRNNFSEIPQIQKYCYNYCNDTFFTSSRKDKYIQHSLFIDIYNSACSYSIVYDCKKGA